MGCPGRGVPQEKGVLEEGNPRRRRPGRGVPQEKEAPGDGGPWRWGPLERGPVIDLRFCAERELWA